MKTIKISLSSKIFVMAADIVLIWCIPKSIVFNHITTQKTWGHVIFQQGNTVHREREEWGLIETEQLIFTLGLHTNP